jgi:hypothetical protein
MASRRQKAKAPILNQRLRAFCRVEATLTPSANSDIKVEVWPPVSGWNNKYLAVGNGGWAGTISYSDLADGISRGYATSSTDTGQRGGSGSFVLGHPEKLIDFAWSSEHEMTVKSKLIVAAMSGTPAKYSFWKGCSTGGRQAMKEIQVFPDDFDGVIARVASKPSHGDGSLAGLNRLRGPEGSGVANPGVQVPDDSRSGPPGVRCIGWAQGRLDPGSA